VTAVDIAIVSDTTLASALVARWCTREDHADSGAGRGAQSSLLARAALRALLARHTGSAAWRIVRIRLGKPFVVDQAGARGPAVSFSHTAGMVAVAMAPLGALGVDIERHRARDFAALAAHAFGPAEQEEVRIGGENAFYRIWTLREAVAKATGDGLALAANGLDLVAGVAAGSYRLTMPGNRDWHLAHVRIEPAWSLGVAHADAPEGPWALRWCDLGEPLAVSPA